MTTPGRAAPWAWPPRAPSSPHSWVARSAACRPRSSPARLRTRGSRRMSPTDPAPLHNAGPIAPERGPPVPAPATSDQDALLRARIKDLSLQLAGTPLEKAIQELHDELEQHGIALRPPCYLTD